MRRLNFLEDEPWDEVDDDSASVVWHPFGADHLGASLLELLPGAPGGPMHMHYGVEEMFFVLSGRRRYARQRERRSWHPETSCTSRKAPTGCTTSRTPRRSR